MFTAIAIHHPKPEHTEDFLRFMARVEGGMQSAPGLVSIESWCELNGGRLFAISRRRRSRPRCPACWQSGSRIRPPG